MNINLCHNNKTKFHLVLVIYGFLVALQRMTAFNHHLVSLSTAEASFVLLDRVGNAEPGERGKESARGTHLLFHLSTFPIHKEPLRRRETLHIFEKNKQTCGFVGEF